MLLFVSVFQNRHSNRSNEKIPQSKEATMPTEATGRKGSKVLRSGSTLSLSGQVPAFYIVYDMGNCQRGKMKHPKYAQQDDLDIFLE